MFMAVFRFLKTWAKKRQNYITTFKKGRTWAMAVRRGSCKSLFLLNSSPFSLENEEIQF